MGKPARLRFVKEPINRKIVSDKDGHVINDIEMVIKLKNLENNKSRIHRFTDFLTQYRNHSPKYVSDMADRLVIFLNYVYFELDEKILSDIQDLSFELGGSFLEQYSENKTRSTLIHMENTVKEFYYFLAKKQLLKNIKEDDFVIGENGNGRRIIESPFAGKYKGRGREVEHPIHHINKNIIFAFLEEVIEVSPQIALGVYLQVFGGLRVSEVISLEYHNISLMGTRGSEGLNIRIQKKNLRPDLKYGHINQAKSPGKQTIINVKDILGTLYILHNQNYKVKNVTAIFLNEDKLPMTSQVYRIHFNKARDSLIKKLIDSNDIKKKTQGIYLKTAKWSTHLCRGVFSNLVAEVATNPVQIAKKRRDTTLGACLTYTTDTEKVNEQMLKLLNDQAIDRLGSKFSN